MQSCPQRATSCGIGGIIGRGVGNAKIGIREFVITKIDPRTQRDDPMVIRAHDYVTAQCPCYTTVTGHTFAHFTKRHPVCLLVLDAQAQFHCDVDVLQTCKLWAVFCCPLVNQAERRVQRETVFGDAADTLAYVNCAPLQRAEGQRRRAHEAHGV